MRGRQWYAVIKPLLLLNVAILQLLPRAVSTFLLVAFRHVPGKTGIALRYPLVKRLCKKCGECVAVFEGAYLFNLQYLELGDHVSIHQQCYIDATGGLKIGADVSIAHACTIMTTDHDFSKPGVAIRDAELIPGPVAIGDDVWLGAAVRVLAGVMLGNRVVVGAGAVVTKNIPDNSIAVGIPARVVKTINQE